MQYTARAHRALLGGPTNKPKEPKRRTHARRLGQPKRIGDATDIVCGVVIKTLTSYYPRLVSTGQARLTTCFEGSGCGLRATGWRIAARFSRRASLTEKPNSLEETIQQQEKLGCTARRGTPKLSDFREDNFLALSPELVSGDDYVRLVRSVCQRDAGFEPTFAPVGSTFEAVMSMVAAGRGVFVAPEIGFRDRTINVNVYVLDRSKGEYELYLIRRNTSESIATVDNFVKIIAESVLRLQTRRQNAEAARRGAYKARTKRGRGME
jgi:hypothetical protein